MDLTLFNEIDNSIQQVTIYELNELPDLIQVYFGIDTNAQIIKYNDNIIDVTKSISEYKIKPNELLIISAQNNSNEIIQPENMLDDHMEDIMMQSCIPHSMIYIRGEYDQYVFKIMIDSGAQPNIMSYSMAQMLGLENQIDKRFHGEAKGVGTSKIYGTIFGCNIKLGKNLHIPINFKVTDLEINKYCVLLGLDFLYIYRSMLDFRNKVLKINDIELKFLNEIEIKNYDIPLNHKQETLKQTYFDMINKLNYDRKIKTINLLNTIIDNILNYPNDDKYKNINIANKTFIDIFVNNIDSMNFIRQLGFEPTNDQKMLKFTNSIEILNYTKEILSS